MGWSDCGTDNDGRPIGYSHGGTCDEPGCRAEIDRGLAYACGGQHGGGEHFCDRYFCFEHLFHSGASSGGDALDAICRGCVAAWDSTHRDCEDCGGWGHLTSEGGATWADPGTHPCPACKGRGWVETDDPEGPASRANQNSQEDPS